MYIRQKSRPPFAGEWATSAARFQFPDKSWVVFEHLIELALRIEFPDPFAAREGCPGCRSLAEGGADLNMTDPEGSTPLLMAILNANFDVAAYLIGKCANVNQWDWYGQSPLYAAVDLNTVPHGGRPDRPSTDETSSEQLIKMLLEAGANPNAQLKLAQPYRAVGPDRGADGMITIGSTPLLRAAKAFDVSAITLLLEKGAS